MLRNLTNMNVSKYFSSHNAMKVALKCSINLLCVSHKISHIVVASRLACDCQIYNYAASSIDVLEFHKRMSAGWNTIESDAVSSQDSRTVGPLNNICREFSPFS